MNNGKLTYDEWAALAALPDEALLRDSEMQAFHAHGPGGQGVNTADSAVHLTHVPTGVAATSRERRSQLQNREACLRKLRAEFGRRAVRPKHRRATKPSKRARERGLESKRRRSELKGSRRPVDRGGE